ncbi:MAG: MarC family protein [Rhodobacteraceae bacterium]|nr:MarC family protein [Paracoccaceae bacterium]
MELSILITSFVTLFVIVDPIGLTPLFVAMTQEMTPKQQRQIAIRSIVVAIGILFAFTLFGDAILRFAGISMPAFRVAGGILLFLTALDMLGPGSIATVILLAGNTPGIEGILWTYAVVSAVMITVFAFFLTAPLIKRALGKTGINVTTRLLGMLLAALAVQFVMDGIADFGLLS